MAISTSNILPLLAFITASLVLLHGANSQSVSFNFPDFSQTGRQLIMQGDASIDTNAGVLQLTRVDRNGNPQSGSVGRVLFNTPVPLRSSTGRLSAFTTSFVFRITSPGSRTPADGITFFLASPESTIPRGSSGGLLGLFSNANALNNSRNEVMDFKLTASDRVVAVEFDTYVNGNLGDPNFRHIGVDVNSIRSRITRRWDWVNNDPVAVTISYQPFSKLLSIVAAHFSGPRVEFSYEIDLTTVLPDTVRVGLSASTGQFSQVNTIQSWSFFSSLQRSYDVEQEGYIASVV